MNGRKQFLAKSVTIGMPAIVTVVLALLAGVLMTISQVLLKSYPEWQGVVTVYVIFVAGIGVSPLTGKAFVTALHLPPWALTLTTAVIAALGGVLQIAVIPHGVHIAIADVLVVLAALGFGATPVVLPSARRHPVVRHPAAKT